MKAGAAPGTYPAVVTVNFEDLNAYPFSSVTILAVRVEPTGQSALHAALSGGKIRGKRTLRCRVHSQSEQPLEIHGRVVTARELARRGDRVILACRSEEKTRPAIEAIIADTGNDAVECGDCHIANRS